ncbi:sulfotransferase [Candidatus Woesearchaeota archaeon]|nr:sulfotransferase [Candidatus Woesearchaeota archaeon]
MKRFIVLCNYRTGSNLLLNLLNSHPSIKCYGELLNPCYFTNDILKSPVKYLKNKFHNSQDRVTGFKMIYTQATTDDILWHTEEEMNSSLLKKMKKSKVLIRTFDPIHLQSEFNKVWDFLEKDVTLKIIHLKRKNLLKSFLSYKKAIQTDEWLKRNNVVSGKKIHLDSDECVEAFNKIRYYELKYDKMFLNHPVLKIAYEDLNEDMTNMINKIFSFLNVNLINIKPSIEKQNNKSLSESISNYKELKKKFNNTRWISFFDE